MSSSRMLAQRNLLVNWQVAPADWEIVNYDEPKWRYRESVQKFIHALPLKSLKKKTFVTIATNVMCADIQSKKDDLDPIDRDLYLPLEISLTKWSMGDSSKSVADRTLNTKVWLIYPGEPTLNSINHANDHKKKQHKIHYDKCDDRKNANIHFEKDLLKVAKEINSMLTPDRIVFSSQLRNCRQDLGSLKWLHRATDYKVFKQPIAAYSLEDLYVVSIRHLIGDEYKRHICQGVARNRMEIKNISHADEILCDYHRDNLLEEDGHTAFCAHAITICFTNALLDDVNKFTIVFGKQDPNESPTKTIQGH